MAFQPLPPELRQKALQIASGYKNGGMVAKFQRGGSVDDDEPGDFMGGADEARSFDSADDPSGLGDLAREAEEATRGMSDEERDFAAEVALEDMERGLRDSDREADDRATTRLLEEEMLAQTQQNIRDTEESIDFSRAVLAENRDALAAIRDARKGAAPAPAVDPLIQEAVRRQAIAQAAQTATPEPSLVEEETRKAATTPIDFLSTTANVDEPVDAITPAQEVQAGLTPDQQRADLAAAEAELAAAQRATPPAFGMAAGKPRISQAGIIGGIADAIFNPEATLANAISERGIGSIDGAPTGRQGGLEVVTADGRTAAYDPERNIVFDSDPFQGVNPFGDERVPEGIQALYDKKRAVDELERDRGDRDDEPITEEEVAVEEEIIPEKPPTIDIVPFRPQDFYYFTPGSFAYNRGIPSMMNMRRG